MVNREDEDAWQLVMSETSDPEVRMKLLAFRVSVLTREKEGLEKRLKRLEVAYLMGQGIFWAAPALMAVTGFLWYNWEWMTRPWRAKGP